MPRPLQASLILLVLFCLLPVQAVCSPFISSDNDRLRSHLIFLNDSGLVDLGVTTWPVMWRDVVRELSQLNLAVLTDAQRNAVYELRFELQRERDSIYKRAIALRVASSKGLFTSASNSDYEKFSLVKTSDWDGDDLSLRLQAQLVKDDKFKTNLDGSYLVGALDNWVLGVGAIDRWWGPGNGSSLILSHNARPTPGLIFRTNGEQSFDSVWLSWIGAWQFTSFVSQLESNRHIPEAKLTGMRFSFRPIEDLELGASRAMMWGGEGRGNDLSSFWKSLTATDENTKQGAGNQLGGFDARYGMRFNNVSGALYAQFIGEDEAGALPSKYLSLFGLDFGIALHDFYVNGFLEYSDTAAGFLNSPQFGAAYEHSVYRSGYHYRDRALGSTFDGDSRSWSLGFKAFLPRNSVASVGLEKVTLNRNNKGRSNTISSVYADVLAFTLKYSFLWQGFAVETFYNYLDSSKGLDDVDNHGVGIELVFRY